MPISRNQRENRYNTISMDLPFSYREVCARKDPYTYHRFVFYCHHAGIQTPQQAQLYLPDDFIPVEDGRVTLQRKTHEDHLGFYLIGTPELRTRRERKHLDELLRREIRQVAKPQVPLISKMRLSFQ